VKLTYNIEGEVRLVFKAGANVDARIAFSPEGQVCNIPSVIQLFTRNNSWVEEQGHDPPRDPIVRQTVKEVMMVHIRPHRRGAAATVREANFADESNIQRERRQRLESAERKRKKKRRMHAKISNMRRRLRLKC
jgi:hypothetical protein